MSVTTRREVILSDTTNDTLCFSEDGDDTRPFVFWNPKGGLRVECDVIDAQTFAEEILKIVANS